MASAIEYGLIAALISVAGITAEMGVNAYEDGKQDVAEVPIPDRVSVTSTDLGSLQRAEAALEVGNPELDLDIEQDTPDPESGLPRWHLYRVN